MSKAKKKKIDRAPLESGKKRQMVSGRVDPEIRSKADKLSKQIYKKGLSGGLEDILIEFISFHK